jgi:hypothetical protein
MGSMAGAGVEVANSSREVAIPGLRPVADDPVRRKSVGEA